MVIMDTSRGDSDPEKQKISPQRHGGHGGLIIFHLPRDTGK